MTRTALQIIGAITTIVLGMAGLYFKVEYSGWVLFVGLMWAAFGTGVA